jgi:hypothetical protein
MDGIPVNVDDIDALAQTLDAGSAKDSLNSLVTAMRTAISVGESAVSVWVEGSLPDMFKDTFEPEPAPEAHGTGQQYHVYLKIGR